MFHQLIMAGLLTIGAFFLGAVPFGLVLARVVFGQDLRRSGSGNIGATNAARTLGLKFGILTLILDMGKGLGPVLAARFLFASAQAEGDPSGASAALIQAVVGLAAFLGHIYSPFLRFKGGKGVATALGVYLGLTPWAVPPAMIVFVLVVALTGYVSAGSLAGASVFPIGAWLLGYPPEFLVLALVFMGLVFFRHRQNIVRLVKGQENKWRKKP